MKKKFLTLNKKGCYSESLKTANTAFTPRQSVFFMPMSWTRAENNQYQPKHLLAAFSESTTLSYLTAILKKANKMTNLSNIYGVYAKLNKILKNVQFKEDDKVSEAVCDAINALETALSICSIKNIEDKKIKLEMLKKAILRNATDFYGNILENEINPFEQEQLTIINQLYAAE